MSECRHCKRLAAKWRRGLCNGCYYQPEIRQLYQSLSKYNPRPGSDFYGRGELPRRPTKARPGTEAKIRVLQRRATSKRPQQLFHPDDARL